MRDFRQSCYYWFLVDKLLLVKITKLGAIEADTKVRAKHSLAFLYNTVPLQNNSGKYLLLKHDNIPNIVMKTFYILTN